MKKLLLSALCILLCSCCTFNFNIIPTQNNAGPKFDVNAAYKSTVRLLAKVADGQIAASGFAIDEDHIMTAKHFCVDVGSADISINFYGSDGVTVLQRGGVKIERMDKTYDLCILKLAGHGLLPVKIAKDYGALKLHSKVFLVGSPLGIFEVESEGQVAVKDLGGTEQFLVVSVPATHGNSGAAIFDENGEVVGVLVAGSDSYNNLALCVPGWQIVAFVAGK